MEKINWGIIGCGDVTELKSGPAFNKVQDSSLLAVMRRDGKKAADYARRHAVPLWYDDASQLINNPEVNAIYIATPPGSHEFYTLAAIRAGKPVYVEKPMTLNAASARIMIEAAREANVKLVVAHYRRAQPMFNKIRQLLQQGSIGKPVSVQLEYFSTAIAPEDLTIPKVAWRVDPAISGGGLFHDLAPHQLGLMIYYFGNPVSASGRSFNTGGLYAADDTVQGVIEFENNITFTGHWDFNAPPGHRKDECVITGSSGEMRFSVFGTQEIRMNVNGHETKIAFDPPRHVQQPLIEKVVQYFLGKGPNPCPPEEGYEIMKLMDAFTGGV
jgi:predicted dehydrogenase